MAAVAVFGALMPALRGEQGPRHVEVALLEAVVAQMAYEWGITAYGGGVAAAAAPPTTSSSPTCYLPCRDGWVIMVAFTEPHWHGLVELMGSPEWAFEPEYADGAVAGRQLPAPCTAHIAEWTQGQLGADVLREAQARGLPCCCSLELAADAVASEQVRRDRVRHRASTATVVPADPIVVDGRRRPRRRLRPPKPRRPGSSRHGVHHRTARRGRAAGGSPGAGPRRRSSRARTPVSCWPRWAPTWCSSRAGPRLISRGFGPFVGEPALRRER